MFHRMKRLWICIATMAVALIMFTFPTTESNASEESPLLITEIVSKSAGTGQPYEYVEIYNNSSDEINLDGYELQYFTSNFSNPANTWPITNKTIQPRDSLVLWLKKFNYPDVPLWDFNSNYDVLLTPDQVFEVTLTTSAQGLHDSALRQVGLANSTGETIVTALINDGEVDGITNKSVIYQKGDGSEMVKIRHDEEPTPGRLVNEQLPGPGTPSGITAEPLNEAVSLRWEIVEGAASYNIYYSASSDPVNVSGENSYILENLTNHETYSFRVTAVDHEGNESSASSVVWATPQDEVDSEAPATPTGLQVTPGINDVELQWNENSEDDLAAYRIYVNGTIYDTVLPNHTRISVFPLELGREYTLEVTALDHVGNESEKATIISGPTENAPIPKVLITEVVPNTDNYARYDAFEYLEIYNNSSEVIDLEGYRVKSGSWDVEIKESLIIEPYDTQLFWTRRQEIVPISLEAFNSNYFGSYHNKYLEAEKVYIFNDIGGLVNSGNQTVTISSPQGLEVVRANYTGDDVSLRNSVVFGYPTDGTLTMETLSGHQPPTPGWVDANQVPERPVLDEDPPATPANVQAIAGYGEVELTWDANEESDLYRYHIYKNGELEFSVSPDQNEFTLSALIGNQQYVLEVAAEDVSGNVSEKSAEISVTPAHQIITQEERSFVEKDPAYQGLWDISEDGPVIPGLAQDLVPQGMTYYKQKDWLLTVSYLDYGRPGTLTVVDATTGELVKSVLLYNQDGTPYTGHAGGLTISKDHIWVASENYLLPFEISELVNAPDNGEIQFIHHIPVPVDAAYTVYDEGILWVGEFYQQNDYPTNPDHHMENRNGEMHYAWMIGFDLPSSTDMLTDEQWNEASGEAAIPDYVLSTTDMVQGAIVGKKGVTLSTSYGRGNDSVLYRYEHPLKEEPHDYVEVAGKTIPLWFLDGAQSKPRESIEAIPMPEGIVADHPKDLYVVFESGANKYRYTTTYPMDRFLKIDLKRLMKDDKEIIKEDIE
ncbi:hypothetical protein GMD78_03785 [Ornithinibacillus sp. L9]|uniref:Uncharacterized protein n=1 Tax=Ornithinibacillus caprae TaxID=2678566 RepID=A0A6N8FE96_9BACI|nr:lamin tail domain-containing protein [Ornithinibacillus caprae]MUK87521.1 hypothetical protein [Ornithinibacillus caprae]